MKKILIAGANFSGNKLSVKSTVLTVATLTAPFDQLLAASLGCKEQIYDGDGALPEDFDGWGSRREYLGAKFLLSAHSGTQIEIPKISKGVEFSSLKIDGFTVKRHRDSEALRVTFRVTMDDSDAKLHQLIHGLKRDAIDVTIFPATKAEALEAERQLSLVDGADDEDEETDVDTTNQDVVDPKRQREIADAVDADAKEVKRGRGRPPGSKNKPKR
jgi:hypothetical protein